MFIQTEATPNPATLKFLPGKPVLPGTTRDYRNAEEAAESPLAQRLFSVAGVAGVFLGQDFITVTKGDAEWQHLKPAILGLIMDHYLSGAPVLLNADAAPHAEGEEFFDAADGEIVTTILQGRERFSAIVRYPRGLRDDPHRIGSQVLVPVPGGAQVPLLRGVLAERHGVAVEVADPLRQVAYDPELFTKQPVEEVAPLLAVGVGLGLRRVE